MSQEVIVKIVSKRYEEVDKKGFSDIFLSLLISLN